MRQFATQMTEWIVDNIAEAFEKKIFPTYKEIFDLFTRVFAQSRQVSFPMDILRMALYERVRGGMIMPVTTVEKERIQEEITESPLAPVLVEEEKNTVVAVSGEGVALLETQEILDDGVFSRELFLLRLEKAGIKSTIIPLLKTAHMQIEGDILEIQTTGFCKSKCMESPFHQMLEHVAQSFDAKEINIIVPNDIQPETSPPEESIGDVARSLFE